MLEIFNFTKMINTKKYTLPIFIAISLLFGLYYYLGVNDFDRHSKIIAILTISFGSLALYLFNWWRERNDIKNGIPAEDELTVKSKVYAGNKTFQFSMILWSIIFVFHETFTEPETMLGTGILGSTLIYGACLLYYKPTQNFDNSSLQ